LRLLRLESALSNAGAISQMPINAITLMSSGRSNVIRCGEFVKEMQRFLPSHVVAETVEKTEFWEYLTHLVQEEATRTIAVLSSKPQAPNRVIPSQTPIPSSTPCREPNERAQF
jgi:hypothetical protein